MKYVLIGSAASLCLVAGFGLAEALGSTSAPDHRLGPMAQVMEDRVGTWSVDMTFRPAPNASQAHSHATQSARLVGGKWLVTELHGDIGGRPFTGVGINGYDARHHKYVGIWVDSNSDAVVPIEGRYDPATRQFTTESDQPAPNGIEHVMSVTRTIDRDTEETTLDAAGPDGKPFTRMTMRLTRAQ